MDQLTVGRRVSSSKMLFRRIAGVSALVAVVVGGLSGVLFLAAGGFRLDSLLDPVRLLGVGSSRAQLLRWGALTDMLGYYLLLVPLFICVGSELRPRGGPIVDLFTVAGVLYAAIGATAAVVLAEAGPVLLRAYDQADPAARSGIALAFQVLTNAVYKGAWQTLEVLPLAVWASAAAVRGGCPCSGHLWTACRIPLWPASDVTAIGTGRRVGDRWWGAASAGARERSGRSGGRGDRSSPAG